MRWDGGDRNNVLRFTISNLRYQEEISSEQWTVRSAVPGRGLGWITLGGVDLEL